MSCSYMEKNHIRDMLEKFSQYTHLPAQAFYSDGTLIYAAGFTADCQKAFDKSEAYKKALHKLQSTTDNQDIMISGWKQLQFAACRICPKTLHKGIIILGPFSVSASDNCGFEYKPSCCIPHLLTLLHNIGADSPFIKQKKAKEKSIYNLYVKNAMAFVDSRYYEEITLSSMADMLGINKCYFAAIFKKETGETFTQYLNRVRVDKSKSLLLQGHSSVLDVAISVGYNNQNYFNMIFKKLTSKTPLEYRNSSALS